MAIPMPPTTPIAATPWGLAALGFALIVYGDLLVRLRQVEPAEPWWYGYARDGVNLAASLMLWGAYLMLGFPGALGLLAGMLTCLTVYLLDWLLWRALHLRHSRWVLAVPMVAWVALTALAPGRVAGLFARLLRIGLPY
jgi:hypothetical protein